MTHPEFPQCPATPHKARWSDYAHARSEANYMQSRGSPRLRVYFCESCRGWHFTKRDGQ